MKALICGHFTYFSNRFINALILYPLWNAFLIEIPGIPMISFGVSFGLSIFISIIIKEFDIVDMKITGKFAMWDYLRMNTSMIFKSLLYVVGMMYLIITITYVTMHGFKAFDVFVKSLLF